MNEGSFERAFVGGRVREANSFLAGITCKKGVK
jgi:hypothetical protein